ncbi:hypothetical protein M436DRAFT_78870 [Aureobasidium namibiae CBS 147.97]|uniref:Uncharacterized protein n=1 Tax=Aureobasidium namibiae CBS 147.97 TaxID=1043004 RepID=A0A074WVH2_9PEZI
MDNPPEPMPKVSIDPLPPAADSPPSPPPASPLPEHIVVTSHEGSVVAVPAAEPTLEKAITPPASESKPPSPPPAPPILPAAPEPVPPPSSPVIVVPEQPASPVVSPAPVIIQQVEPVPAQAAPATTPAPASPTPVIVEKVKEPQPPTLPPVSTAATVESPASSANAPTAPDVPLMTNTPTVVAAIGRSDTATFEPQKKSDKVPVLVATRSAPELQQDSHEVQTRPSTLSFSSAPPETFVRRNTHVVVIDPAVNEEPKRHWRDRVRKFWVSKLGGRFFLRMLLGHQGSNVATAVVSRY